MQSALKAFKKRLPPFLRPTQLPSGYHLARVPPLYQRTPPFWARWTYALVACDLFMTTSAVDLTWNRWTREETSEPDPNSPTDPPKHFVPRPVWQRLALCLVHLGIGVGAAVVLIGSHARVVRTLCILPGQPPAAGAPSSRPARIRDTRRLVIQCSHNRRHNGTVFPLARCKLHPGRDGTELILRVDGMRGHWWVGLDGAVVDGREVGVARAREVIFGAWAQEGDKKWERGGWNSGPIVA